MMNRWTCLGLAWIVLAGWISANPLDQANSQFAKMGKVRVHYKSIGKGNTALVFIHGWACDMSFWREQVPAFDGKIRMILVDLPGHGQSDKPEAEYTMGFFARAVHAVLKDAKVHDAVLVGHSMGTPVIRQYLRLYPDSVKALVSVDGAFRPYTLDPARIQTFVEPLTQPDYRDAIGKMVDGMFHADSPEELRAQVKAVMQNVPQYVAVSAFRNMFTPSIWAVDPITVPLLAVYARSPLWTEDYQAFLRKLSPGCDIQFMDGVGHFLMLERPADFNERLTSFLVRLNVLSK
jgi:pimeloyl-ACP methyl ester carboxylesterase